MARSPEAVLIVVVDLGADLREESRSLIAKVENVASIVSGSSVCFWNQSVYLLWLDVGVELNEVLSGRVSVILSIESGSSLWIPDDNMWLGSVGLWNQSLDLLWLNVGVESLGWVVLAKSLLSSIGEILGVVGRVVA